MRLDHIFVAIVWCVATVLPVAGYAADLAVGDAAPLFSLEGTDGKTHSLADFKGKQTVVLAWYPKAYTSGCTIECKSLAEHGDLIRHYDVTYFMASVDPIEKNKGFAAQQNADFPLLSDPTKATARAYGVLSALGVANRTTFVIGTDGNILAIDRHVNPATAAQDIATTLGNVNVPIRSSTEADQATAAHCTALEAQYDAAEKSSVNVNKLKKAELDREQGSDQCAQGKLSDGIKTLQRALKYIGVKADS